MNIKISTLENLIYEELRNIILEKNLLFEQEGGPEGDEDDEEEGGGGEVPKGGEGGLTPEEECERDPECEPGEGPHTALVAPPGVKKYIELPEAVKNKLAIQFRVFLESGRGISTREIQVLSNLLPDWKSWNSERFQEAWDGYISAKIRTRPIKLQVKVIDTFDKWLKSQNVFSRGTWRGIEGPVISPEKILDQIRELVDQKFALDDSVVERLPEIESIFRKALSKQKAKNWVNVFIRVQAPLLLVKLEVKLMQQLINDLINDLKILNIVSNEGFCQLPDGKGVVVSKKECKGGWITSDDPRKIKFNDYVIDRKKHIEAIGEKIGRSTKKLLEHQTNIFQLMGQFKKIAPRIIREEYSPKEQEGIINNLTDYLLFIGAFKKIAQDPSDPWGYGVLAFEAILLIIILPEIAAAGALFLIIKLILGDAIFVALLAGAEELIKSDFVKEATYEVNRANKLGITSDLRPDWLINLSKGELKWE